MRRSQILLIASATIIPLLIFTGVAWERRTTALHDGDAEIVRTLSQITDNLRFVLHSEKGAVLSVLDHIQDMTWERIADPSTSEYLRQVAEISPDAIDAIWIADP